MYSGICADKGSERASPGYGRPSSLVDIRLIDFAQVQVPRSGGHDAAEDGDDGTGPDAGALLGLDSLLLMLRDMQGLGKRRKANSARAGVGPLGKLRGHTRSMST